MGYANYYRPLVRAPNLVWPLRLPIVCHVAQSHVIQSHLDHHTLARLRIAAMLRNLFLFFLFFFTSFLIPIHHFHPWK